MDKEEIIRLIKDCKSETVRIYARVDSELVFSVTIDKRSSKYNDENVGRAIDKVVNTYDLDDPLETKNSDTVCTYEFAGHLKNGYYMPPVYKCNNMSIKEKAVIFEFSKYFGERIHHTSEAPGHLTFAIAKSDLKKLLNELDQEQIDERQQ